MVCKVIQQCTLAQQVFILDGLWEKFSRSRRWAPQFLISGIQLPPGITATDVGYFVRQCFGSDGGLGQSILCELTSTALPVWEELEIG
jgi:hypothetical protein